MRLTIGKANVMVDQIIDTGAVKKSVSTRTKYKALSGLTKNNTRITGVTTCISDIPTGGKSEKPEHAIRDMVKCQLWSDRASYDTLGIKEERHS